MTTTTRSASRTLAGLLAPLLACAIAACFILLATLHTNDAIWLGLGKAARLFVEGIAILAAVSTEMLVLRQKNLIGSGQIVEATVDEVRELAWSKQHLAAYYHFFTEDRRVITACCAIDNKDSDRWARGQKINAIYDPARPARHILNDSSWAAVSKTVCKIAA